MSINVVDRIIGDPQVVTAVNNQNVIQKIDRVSNIAFLRFRLTGTLTNGSYSTAPTKLVESLENYIASVTINVTGKGSNAINEPLKSVDLNWLNFLTRILEGTAPTRTDVGTTNAAYNFETNAKAFFAHPPKFRSLSSLSPRELATLLLFDARTAAAFTITFQFRDATALVTGGSGGTSVLSNVQVTTQAREVLGLNPAVRPFLKESQVPFNITASAQGTLLKDMPVGNIIKRMLFKGFVGANNWSDPSDAPFNNTTPAEGPHVRLRANGSYYPMDVVYQQQRAENKELYSMESLPAGYMLWEPSGGFNARYAEKLDALVDANFTNSNTNTIQVTTQEIVVRGGAVAAA